MARKRAAAASSETPRTRKQPARRRSTPRMSSTREPQAKARAPQMPGFGDLPKMGSLMTPEQAIELYKTNAALALSIINAAIESTARLRKKQFEGEEEVREFHKRHARTAAEARDAQGLVAAGQGAAQEALERSMHYWSEMFDLIVEIQKRLFALLDEQMADVPGVKETKAAMAMLPDLSQMKKVVSAMQGVVASGGSTFETMQRVIGDFAKLAQAPMSAGRR